jgi:hypothetical protein
LNLAVRGAAEQQRLDRSKRHGEGCRHRQGPTTIGAST